VKHLLKKTLVVSTIGLLMTLSYSSNAQQYEGGSCGWIKVASFGGSSYGGSWRFRVYQPTQSCEYSEMKVNTRNSLDTVTYSK